MADAPAPLVPLLAAMSALVGWLHEAKIPGVVIGGVAVSLLGRPRATRDVDAVMWLDNEQRLADLVKAASTHGLQPRMDDVVSFARQNRVLLLRHESSSVDLDIALGGLPFEQEAIAQAIERASWWGLRERRPWPPPGSHFTPLTKLNAPLVNSGVSRDP